MWKPKPNKWSIRHFILIKYLSNRSPLTHRFLAGILLPSTVAFSVNHLLFKLSEETRTHTLKNTHTRNFHHPRDFPGTSWGRITFWLTRVALCESSRGWPKSSAKRVTGSGFQPLYTGNSITGEKSPPPPSDVRGMVLGKGNRFCRSTVENLIYIIHIHTFFAKIIKKYYKSNTNILYFMFLFPPSKFKIQSILVYLKLQSFEESIIHKFEKEHRIIESWTK